MIVWYLYMESVDNSGYYSHFHNIDSSNPRTWYIYASMDTFSLTNEAKVYSGEKIVSSVSGAGKVVQLYVR